VTFDERRASLASFRRRRLGASTQGSVLAEGTEHKHQHPFWAGSSSARGFAAADFSVRISTGSGFCACGGSRTAPRARQDHGRPHHDARRHLAAPTTPVLPTGLVRARQCGNRSALGPSSAVLVIAPRGGPGHRLPLVALMLQWRQHRPCVARGFRRSVEVGHLGHQFSHAPGRPVLHLVSSSRRPRRETGYVTP
jgi:hypothetical protein